MIDGDVRKLPRLIKFLLDILTYAALAVSFYMMLKYPVS